MPNLRRVPTLVYVILLVAAVFAALSIGGALWLEAAENQRVMAGGEPDIQVGLGYAMLAGFVPVVCILGAAIATGILLAKRTRARQDAGLTLSGWGNRAGTTLMTMVILLAGVSIVVWLVWYLCHVMLVQSYGEEIIGAAGMAGSFPTVLGLVFGPGMTGALPAILLTASAPTAEEENA